MLLQMTHTSRVNGNQSVRIQEPAMLLKSTYTFRVNSTPVSYFLSSQLSGKLLNLVFEN